MAFLSLRNLGRRPHDDLKPGDSYRRRQSTCVEETATVLAIRRDLVGIPHVLFKVAFECSDSNGYEEGSRTLALDSFREVYRERVRYAPADAPAAQAQEPEVGMGLAFSERTA